MTLNPNWYLNATGQFQQIGSGQIGTVSHVPHDVNPQGGTFKDVPDWVAYLDQWISDDEWQDAKPESAALANLMGEVK